MLYYTHTHTHTHTSAYVYMSALEIAKLSAIVTIEEPDSKAKNTNRKNKHYLRNIKRMCLARRQL